MKTLPTTLDKFRAFSLVEVVIAVGIVAFSVTVSVALISTLMASSKDNRDRNEITASLSSLRPYLQDELGFDKCYDLAATGFPELAYVTYRANEVTGAPDGDSRSVRSLWFAPNSNDPDLLPPFSTADIEAARDGAWVKARLVYAADLMPGGTAGGPDSAYLIFNAAMSVIAQPASSAPARPTLETPIAVIR